MKALACSFLLVTAACGYEEPPVSPAEAKEIVELLTGDDRASCHKLVARGPRILPVL